MPIDLVRAISHANKILDWHEHLQEADIPPEWMWPFDKELVTWFEEVKRANASPSKSDERTVVPMMENDLARGRR